MEHWKLIYLIISIIYLGASIGVYDKPWPKELKESGCAMFFVVPIMCAAHMLLWPIFLVIDITHGLKRIVRWLGSGKAKP